MGDRYEITDANVAAHMADEAKREAMRAQHRATNAALQDERRCPDCGMWLSTRYSAGQPHACLAVHVQATEQLRKAMATALDSPTLRGRLEPGWTPSAVAASPAPPEDHGIYGPNPPWWVLGAGQAPKTATHALKTVGWPWAAPARQSAPAGAPWPWRAIVLAWLAGAASAFFVAALVVLLL